MKMMVLRVKGLLPRKRWILAGIGLSVAAVLLGVVALVKIDALRERSKVIELTDIEQLKDAFNEDAGSVRMIVLLSPT